MSVQAREICSVFIPYCRQVTGMRETCIKIDPACKALRAEFDLLGFYTDKADNNAKDIKGSSKGIAVGIEYLQSSIADENFSLVENERFGHLDFLREIGMYCVDSNGNLLMHIITQWMKRDMRTIIFIKTMYCRCKQCSMDCQRR